MFNQRLLLIAGILVLTSGAPLFLAEIMRPQADAIADQVSHAKEEG